MLGTVHQRGSWQRLGLGCSSLVIATVIWLPLVHLFFRSNPSDYRSSSAIPSRATKLVERHIQLWRDAMHRKRATEELRAVNPEWDLMSRSYLVLSLVNMSLRNSDRTKADLLLIDQIIDDTLALEQQAGHFHFLLAYAHASRFRLYPVRSHHVDSQLGLMLAARCMLAPLKADADLLRDRVQIMQRRMASSPVLASESYPDECWMYDIVNGLVVMRMAEIINQVDHSAFIEEWLAVARDELVDPDTGLLISSFTRDGQPLDGPEGSSIWMIAHGLQLLDPDFARQQFDLARHELSESLFGFGYAREWPASWAGPVDVDSGPPIPLLNVSAGSSGLAVVAASAFEDKSYLSELFTTLDFAAFPTEHEQALRYCASNELGDAVVLYATVLGPLWERVELERAP